MKTNKKTIKAVKYLLSDDSHSKHHLKIELTKNLLPHIFESETEHELVITKEQIFLLYKDAENNTPQLVSADLRKWFPELFLISLENSKWYKTTYGALVLNKNGCLCGFVNGEWKDYILNISELDLLALSHYNEATEQEVTEALTKEAINKGFKEGCCFKVDNGTDGFNKFTGQSKYENGNLYNNGWRFFFNGIWAEIIPTITKEEAEKELGKKIID